MTKPPDNVAPELLVPGSDAEAPPVRMYPPSAIEYFNPVAEPDHVVPLTEMIRLARAWVETAMHAANAATPQNSL